jgi:hypothetical protein
MQFGREYEFYLDCSPTFLPSFREQVPDDHASIWWQVIETASQMLLSLMLTKRQSRQLPDLKVMVVIGALLVMITSVGTSQRVLSGFVCVSAGACYESPTCPDRGTGCSTKLEPSYILVFVGRHGQNILRSYLNVVMKRQNNGLYNGQSREVQNI